MILSENEVKLRVVFGWLTNARNERQKTRFWQVKIAIMASTTRNWNGGKMNNLVSPVRAWSKPASSTQLSRVLTAVKANRNDSTTFCFALLIAFADLSSSEKYSSCSCFLQMNVLFRGIKVPSPTCRVTDTISTPFVEVLHQVLV